LNDSYAPPTDPKTILATLPVEFVGSFPDPNQVLEPPLPEVMFLGRSNVGKSSLINAVVGRKIAKTSGTPGKTQLLVAFRFPGFYLLDLPGYGYAKLNQSERHRLRALVDGAIRTRPRVRTVVWLLDIRHEPSKDDLAMRDLLAESGREAIVVLTKSDKLTQSQRIQAVRDRARTLDVDPDDLVMTSSAKGTSIPELAELIQDAAGET
jgi:GTP-binding protein